MVMRKILLCMMVFLVYQVSYCGNLSYRLGFHKQSTLKLLSYNMRNRIEDKKFGEDLYRSFKTKEKKIKNTIKGIIIPKILEDNMDIDIKIAKEFQFTCKYKYEF